MHRVAFVWNPDSGGTGLWRCNVVIPRARAAWVRATRARETMSHAVIARGPGGAVPVSRDGRRRR